MSISAKYETLPSDDENLFQWLFKTLADCHRHSLGVEELDERLFKFLRGRHPKEHARIRRQLNEMLCETAQSMKMLAGLLRR